MSFTCPDCGRTSYNPNDEAARYCGSCHRFFHDATFAPITDDLLPAAALGRLQRELVDAQRVIANLVQAAGGRLVITDRQWTQPDNGRALVRYRDQTIPGDVFEVQEAVK